MAPLCTLIDEVHRARDTIVAAIQRSEVREFDEAIRLAKEARAQVPSMSNSTFPSAGPSDADRELRIGIISIGLFVDQTSRLLDGSAGPPDLRNIKPPIETVMPMIDRTLGRVDQLATAGTRGGVPPCAGATFSFTPASLLLAIPAAPDLGALHLPAAVGGHPLSVSVEWVQAGTVAARVVEAAGGSVRTAVSADAESSSGLSFSILRIPGIEVSRIVLRYAADVFPEASDRRLIVIDGVTVYRFDTPPDPEAPSETFFVVPRGDALFVFEDATEADVRSVLQALR